jgi:3-oxocholest-4-en-26-oate---CoA ligase
VQGSRRVTYRELEDRAARLAAAWAAAGVVHGAHVALYLHNCPEYLECLFACSKLRALPVNVNFRYGSRELADLVDNSDAEVLVYHRSLAGRVVDARDAMPRVHTLVELDDGASDTAVADARDYDALVRTHAPMTRIARAGDDLLLWYTGGTTGMPKGVLWHQGTLLDFGLATTYALQDEPPASTLAQLVDDVARWRATRTTVDALLTTPLVHATAVHQANSALSGGATVVLLEPGPVDGDTVCTTIATTRPRVLQVVGDVVVRRVAHALQAAEARGESHDLSSLQRVHNSGAMVHAQLKDALLSRGTMHFYDSLGSTEAVGFGFARTSTPGSAETARFTLGPNARLLTADDRDVARGSGEAGVLAVCRSTGFAYYGDAARTAQTFRELDGVLYAMPGDWATIDADGTLTLLGRGSGCINTGGEKVWPEEVEVVLREHPAVIDAVVLGLPDDEWGEIVAAVVAVAVDRSLSAEDLSEWVGGRLARYKRPRRVELRAEVVRNSIGKVDYEWARGILLP